MNTYKFYNIPRKMTFVKAIEIKIQQKFQIIRKQIVGEVEF